MDSEITLIVLTLLRLVFPITLLLIIGTRIERDQKSGKGGG